jgi:RHS repeat-associated protein
MVDYGSNNRVRFRYVGLTTSVAQTIDDQSGSILRNVGTSWTGERLLDWTGTNSNIRYYGSNAHHDTVWTASSTGTVSGTLRFDPWGTLTSSTGASLPDFRFQGSWFDTITSLQWVVTRWYAPGLGRFLSEDSLLGDPADPPSRHLYAYAEADPIRHWDPFGRSVYWNGFGYPSYTTDVLFTPAGTPSYARFKFVDGGWLMVVHSESWNTAVIDVKTKTTTSVPIGSDYGVKWELRLHAASLYTHSSFGGVPILDLYGSVDAWLYYALKRNRGGIWATVMQGRAFHQYAVTVPGTAYNPDFLFDFRREQGPWDRTVRPGFCRWALGCPYVLKKGDSLRVDLHLHMEGSTFGAGTVTGDFFVNGLRASLINL